MLVLTKDKQLHFVPAMKPVIGLRLLAVLIDPKEVSHLDQTRWQRYLNETLRPALDPEGGVYIKEI